MPAPSFVPFARSRSLCAALWVLSAACGDSEGRDRDGDASVLQASDAAASHMLDASHPTSALDASDGSRATILGDARVLPSEPAPGDAATDANVPSLHPVVADPWLPVPRDQVLSECKLDPALLEQADSTLNTPWAVVRYGKLCHVFGDPSTPTEVYSATKTLGALVAGIVSYETRALVNTGHKTGPFSDEDRVDQWLEPAAISYNKDAHVAHVLAMVGQNADLSQGKKPMVYDLVGATQINSVSDMLNVALKQDTARLGADLEQFTRKFLFERIGMINSWWSEDKPDKVLGVSWNASLIDMARVGMLMLDRGQWNGERLLSEDWVYRMTHPAFEDSSTGYGYLTWLNAKNNYGFSVLDMQIASTGAPIMPGPCAPVSIYDQHPHGLSTVSDCGYGIGYSCAQTYDVGVWQAIGLYGQVIQGHPGLDLVVVGKQLTPTLDVSPAGDGPAKLWDALTPAVVAGDPIYANNLLGFCAAYGGNNYAPDWKP